MDVVSYAVVNLAFAIFRICASSLAFFCPNFCRGQDSPIFINISVGHKVLVDILMVNCGHILSAPVEGAGEDAESHASGYAASKVSDDR
jgi:hypothetical protein